MKEHKVKSILYQFQVVVDNEPRKPFECLPLSPDLIGTINPFDSAQLWCLITSNGRLNPT